MTIDDLDTAALAALGAAAVGMLCRGEIASLADQYGYALSYDRDAASAIQMDLSYSLSEVGAASLRPLASDPVQCVKYFEPNTSNLVAVVECLAPTDRRCVPSGGVHRDQ